MKKFLKIVVLCGIVACFGIMPGKISEVNAAQNYVPAYYYANYKFIDDWNEIWNIFRNLTAKKDLELDIDPKVFSELYKHFVRSFPHLTPYYETVYEKCRLLADDLRN